jgi:serine phosphatase RsbU (regulator of sigma subunit)/putative methionine-R-sulfoxide reductase with GAF domain
LGHQLLTLQKSPDWLAILTFIGLSFLIQRSSFRLGSPNVHSFSGVIDLAAVLALGSTAGALVAAASGFGSLFSIALQRRNWTSYELMQIPFFNAGLKAGMALLSGALLESRSSYGFLLTVGVKAKHYYAPSSVFPLGEGELLYRSTESTPVLSSDLALILVVCAVSILWFGMDHLGWGILDYIEGGSAKLRAFVRDAIPYSLLVELLPLPFALVVALAYTSLGWLAFALVLSSIIVVSVLTQRWAKARSELVRRVSELTSIEEISRAVAEARLDVDELCELIYEHASQIVDTTNFQLGLFDGDNYAIKLWIRDGRRESLQTFSLTPGVGLINWLRCSRQPILVKDFAKEMDALPAKPTYVSDAPPKSGLFVPLVASPMAALGTDETVIGAMSIQSSRKNAFGDRELRVLSAMASQAAIAIQKTQFYAQERKRARQLETIGQVSRQVAAVLELDELFRRTVHLIRENFGYYHVAIFTVDSVRQSVTFQASASAGDRDIVFDVIWGEGLIGSAAAQSQTILVNNVQNEPRYQCVDALDETCSELVVPLLLDNELVGVLDVQSDQVDAFGPDDLFILEAMADQIALAIHVARLYEAERQQAWLSMALLQIADTTSQVSHMDAVLATIVRLTPMLVGVERCAILFWDRDTEEFVAAQAHGLPKEQRDLFLQQCFPVGAAPVFDLVRLEKRPWLVNIERDAPLFPKHLRGGVDIQEMIVLPLMAQGELLGIMVVDSAGKANSFSGPLRRQTSTAAPPLSPVDFSPPGSEDPSAARMVVHGSVSHENIDMLIGISNQAAMVIQSARLLQAQQEEAYASMALLQAAEAVSGSNDLGEILSSITRITAMLVGVERCAILLRTPEGGNFWPFQQYGLPREVRSIYWQWWLGPDDPLARQIMTGEPKMVSPQEVESTEIALLGEGSSLLVLPLVTKVGVVGAMLVLDRPSELSSTSSGAMTRYLTQRRLHILTGIAHQAAIAVENDRLLQEATEQERMKQELDVARRIQTSFLPERCPNVLGWQLATLWRSAREVSGDFYDFFPLPAEEIILYHNAGPAIAPGDTLEQAELARSTDMDLYLRRGMLERTANDKEVSPGREPAEPDTPPTGRTGVVIADVADKGVPAALFMALCRTLVRTMAMDGRPPNAAVRRANDLIMADARSGLFVTLFYGILGPDSGEIVYVNAGHLPPILVRAESGNIEELQTGDAALGLLPGFEYSLQSAHLDVGDVLILYTDGVTEATDTHQQMFGKRRLIEAIRSHRGQTAQELVETVIAAVDEFVGEASQSDDLTLVVLKRGAA